MMVGLNTEYFTDSAPPLELADSKPSYVNSGVENIRNRMKGAANKVFMQNCQNRNPVDIGWLCSLLIEYYTRPLRLYVRPQP